MPAPLRDVPQEGIELIKSFEGIPDGDPSSVNLDAYLDPVGIWTIGWGHAITYQGVFLRGPQNKGIARALYPGGITIEQAEMLLRGELVNFARDVLRLAKVPLDDGQFAALVSLRGRGRPVPGLEQGAQERRAGRTAGADAASPRRARAVPGRGLARRFGAAHPGWFAGGPDDGTGTSRAAARPGRRLVDRG